MAAQTIRRFVSCFFLKRKSEALFAQYFATDPDAMLCDTLNVNQSNQALQYEVQYLRDTLSKERESAEKTFQVSRCCCARRLLCLLWSHGGSSVCRSFETS